MSSKLKKFFNKIEPSLSIWLLKIIAVQRLFCGFYINVNKSKPLCYLIKLYCITVCSVIDTFYYKYLSRSFIFFVFMEYTFTVIVYLVNADEQFWKYYSAIKTGDRIMGFKKLSLIPRYVFFIIFINSVMRVAITLNRGDSLSNMYLFFSLTIALISNDLNQITIIIIFSILHSRIKQLKTFLYKISVPINITGRNEVAISIKNIRKSLYNYNNLLDHLKLVDKQLQYMLFFSLITNSYKITFLLYNVVKKCIDGNALYTILTFMLEILQGLFILASPSIIVESTSYEVDQIKITLTKQLLLCSDESLRFELETALQFVSMHPFSYAIFRAVPLNSKLPFIIISVCTTYVIVIMQLTHFSFNF